MPDRDYDQGGIILGQPIKATLAHNETEAAARRDRIAVYLRLMNDTDDA